MKEQEKKDSKYCQVNSVYNDTICSTAASVWLIEKLRDNNTIETLYRHTESEERYDVNIVDGLERVREIH